MSRKWAKRHPAASYFVLAYAISWLAWLPAVAGYRGDLNQPLSMIAQFGPALAALVVAWYSGASVRGWVRRIVRWRVAPWWYGDAGLQLRDDPGQFSPYKWVILIRTKLVPGATFGGRKSVGKEARR